MKNIIELKQIVSTCEGGKHIWKVVLIVREENDYVQETWIRELAAETLDDQPLWMSFRKFICDNRKNYKELKKAFVKYGFDAKREKCIIYPEYWDLDEVNWEEKANLEYLVYAGRVVYKKDTTPESWKDMW